MVSGGCLKEVMNAAKGFSQHGQKWPESVPAGTPECVPKDPERPSLLPHFDGQIHPGIKHGMGEPVESLFRAHPNTL